MFRGREMARTELGRKILDRLVADLGDSAVVESVPKQDGRNMVMVIAPMKKHPDNKSEAERPANREAASEPRPGDSAPAPQEVAAAVEQPQEAQ